MITSVEIKGFRGIREGKLTDLTPLVVLVGPNGSGKSSVIEALLIGASPLAGDAIVQVIRRHETGGSGPAWLFWRAGQFGPAEVTVAAERNATRTCRLSLDRNHPENQTVVTFAIIENSTRQLGAGSVVAVDNRYNHHTSPGHFPFDGAAEVHLVEGYSTAFQRPLYDLYTRAVQRGRRSEAKAIVSDVFPGVMNVELLTEGPTPIPHLVFENYSVPASLAGDGIQSLLRLSLELAASGGGMALLEEPEVHQHPAAIRQSAKAILAAVRRNIQVVMTTHSLELIDALLAESTPEDLEKLSLYSLLLQGGVLKSSRLPGPEVDFARGQIEDDLR